MSSLNALKRRLVETFDTNWHAWTRFLNGELQGCDSVLDIGCGSESPLRYVQGDFHSVGVDAHRPSLEASRSAGIHDDYVEQDARDLDFPPASFDAVLLLDLVEHLEREAAIELLRRAETIARRRVLIFTPNGFLPQDDYGDNPFQRHRSGWTAQELRTLGYRVMGFNGWKPLRGYRSLPRRPTLITRPLSILSQPLVARRPERAFALLAAKDDP